MELIKKRRVDTLRRRMLYLEGRMEKYGSSGNYDRAEYMALKDAVDWLDYLNDHKWVQYSCIRDNKEDKIINIAEEA